MRLTADLIQRSPSFLNPVKEREIELRGFKIVAIENLGATQDQYDCIDLSDNEIVKLENFPLLNRLRTMLLNHNRINRIDASNMKESLPNLQTLILTNNKFTNLSELDSLAELKSLKNLCLLDNLVTKKPHYRLYVIHKMPHLSVLDFRRIKPQERKSAEKLFSSTQLESKKAKLQDTNEEQQQSTSQAETFTSQDPILSSYSQSEKVF
jgi:U2 small nuclear ribonucleoprotein A'